MQLSAFSVKNHTRIADCHIAVRKHLVLVGPNDSGKTSLLRCLHLVLGADNAALYTSLTQDDICNLSEPCVIEAEFKNLNHKEQQIFGAAVRRQGGKTSVKIRLKIRWDADNETLIISRIAVGTPSGRQINSAQLKCIGWYMFDPQSPPQSADILAQTWSNMDIQKETQTLEHCAHTVEEFLAYSPQLRQLRQRLATQLSSALPGNYEEKNLVFTVEKAWNAISLQLLHDGKQRDIRDQSSGFKAIIDLALLDDPGNNVHIIGIDEPETHLHPASQRNLAAMLAHGDAQKIIVTHAPEIISEFEPDQITVVRSTGTVVQPQSNFLDNDERTLLHMWTGSRIEPLTANCVIVVEGITDRAIVERCAQVTGRNLDARGIVVLQADGWRNMSAWNRIFGKNGYSITLAQLIDEDAAKETAQQYKISIDQLPRKMIYVSQPDIEGEYVRAFGAHAVVRALQQHTSKQSDLTPLVTAYHNDSLTEEQVAAFCRKQRHKTDAILAILPHITDATARKIHSVEQMLADLDDFLQ